MPVKSKRPRPAVKTKPSVRAVAVGGRIAVGLMSGTSADGVDAAVLRVTGKGLKMRSKLLAYHGKPYGAELRRRVMEMMAPATVDIEALCDLDFRLAEFFAITAIEAIDKARLNPEDVAALGSHGQTVCHLPPDPKRQRGSTLQLADPGVIAARTGVLTVGNFRTADMALGGQGAPLVPVTDWLMFADPRKTRILLNIGGIANLTYLPAAGKSSDVLAFDTGPGNCLLDSVAQIISRGQLQCDQDGQLASAGQVLTEFLVDWLAHPYFRRRPPKSTGREDFSRQLAERWLRTVLKTGATGEDMMATLTELTATTIARAIKDFLPRLPDEVIVYGGGSANPTLMAALGQLLGRSIKLIDHYGMPAKAKEAASFALLALLRLDRVAGNVPRSTGASRPTVLGGVFRP